MLTLIIVLAGIVQLFVSFFVLLQSRRNLSNKLFFLIGLSTLSWALTNYLTIVFLESNYLIYFVRSILLFVVLQNAFFYMFARTFPSSRWNHSKKWLYAYGLFTALTAIATITPYVFTSVEIDNGLPVTKAGPAILLFIAHAAISISIAFKALVDKKNKARPSYKTQYRVLLFASFLNWVIVPITNFAITPVLKTTLFIVASPIYTLVFASLIAYAIIAHKLFDIKAVIARLFTYTLTVLGMLAILVTGSFLLSNAFVDFEISSYESIYFISLSVLLALLFQSIKSFFDKFTSKLFFQSEYSPEEILDEYSDHLAGEIEVNEVIRYTKETLQKSLHPTKTEIFLYSKSSKSFVLMTDEQEKQRDRLIKTLEYQNTNTILVDDANLSDEPFTKNIVDLLVRENLAISVRLITSDELIGFLVLGDKKDGRSYKNKDIKFLNIMANGLAVALQNAQRFDEIQAFNVKLKGKVETATKELRDTNKKLMELDEAKDDFISMASHQLRTPLTSIKGYLSMILEGDAGDVNDNQRKMIDAAFTSSQRMVYLISDLLNVSRLKTGKFVIEPREVKLSKIIEGEVLQLVATAHSRDIEIDFQKPDDFPSVMLDETKIRQVIMNFIDNAIYYTKSGGKIEIRLHSTPKAIEFTVKDNGIGVDKKDQAKLFTKFFRASNAKKARPDGTGLGLFMAKKIIVAQGGAIIFKSKRGKGSTFGFTFPLDKIKPKDTKQ